MTKKNKTYSLKRIFMSEQGPNFMGNPSFGGTGNYGMGGNKQLAAIQKDPSVQKIVDQEQDEIDQNVDDQKWRLGKFSVGGHTLLGPNDTKTKETQIHEQPVRYGMGGGPQSLGPPNRLVQQKQFVPKDDKEDVEYVEPNEKMVIEDEADDRDEVEKLLGDTGTEQDPDELSDEDIILFMRNLEETLNSPGSTFVNKKGWNNLQINSLIVRRNHLNPGGELADTWRPIFREPSKGHNQPVNNGDMPAKKSPLSGYGAIGWPKDFIPPDYEVERRTSDEEEERSEQEPLLQNPKAQTIVKEVELLKTFIREIIAKPEAKKDDIFGRYLFAPDRNDVPKPPEENTYEEDKFFNALERHYNGDMTKLNPWIKTIVSLVKQGKYKSLLKVPDKYKYAYRFMTLSPSQFFKLIGRKLKQVEYNEYPDDVKEIKGGIFKGNYNTRNHFSWTVSLEAIQETNDKWYGGIVGSPGMDEGFFVVMRAPIKPNLFVLNPDKTGIISGEWDFQEEVISIGNVKLDKIIYSYFNLNKGFTYSDQDLVSSAITALQDTNLKEIFKSKAQQKYFWHKASQSGKEGKKWKKMAKEFQASTPKNADLPQKVDEVMTPMGDTALGGTRAFIKSRKNVKKKLNKEDE